MPIYVYRCETCGEMDVQQKFHEKVLTRCPMCGYDSIKKVFTTPAITFNGSGFYSTDSKG